MANTLVPASPTAMIYTGREAVVYLTIASDGSNETGTIVYDSSVVAALIANQVPGFVDPLTSRILEVYASCSSANTARVKLLFDATTDTLAMDIPVCTNPTKANFRRFGGLVNSGGSGKTGDILVTTTGLAAGDAITLVLTVGAY